jgi:hypothetical protein
LNMEYEEIIDLDLIVVVYGNKAPVARRRSAGEPRHPYVTHGGAYMRPRSPCASRASSSSRIVRLAQGVTITRREEPDPLAGRARKDREPHPTSAEGFSKTDRSRGGRNRAC